MTTLNRRVPPLEIETLAFPESELLRWKQGNYGMLVDSQASLFLKRILVEKAQNRSRPSRRFFGEAYVASRVRHERGWYGSFKWLTTTAPTYGSQYSSEFRVALSETFPSVSDLPAKALGLRRLLNGKQPVPPDLWLIVNGEHRFIEVKLPQDSVRLPQLAGLALIATCLSNRSKVSVWIYDLYPDGGHPRPLDESVQRTYRGLCRAAMHRRRRRALR